MTAEQDDNNNVHPGATGAGDMGEARKARDRLREIEEEELDTGPLLLKGIIKRTSLVICFLCLGTYDEGEGSVTGGRLGRSTHEQRVHQ